MRIGSPFNPYKVLQGVFAPYWILEHRGIGTGAKLCYIRLLGFAGKDARCYPSLETLGKSLGVSDRQAHDYVKELERAGLGFVECDHVIEDLAPATSHPSLRDSIQPRCLYARSFEFQTRCLQKRIDLVIEC